MDNVFIERLWRSIKYEEIYLFEHSTVTALRAGVAKWFARYNDWRPHETLGNLTPAVFYQNALAGPDEDSRATTPEAA
jgi:putative transposase